MTNTNKNRALTTTHSIIDSQGPGDVAGQSPQASGGLKAESRSASLEAILRIAPHGGSAGHPGWLQGSGEEPLHSTCDNGVLGNVEMGILL